MSGLVFTQGRFLEKVRTLAEGLEYLTKWEEFHPDNDGKPF